MDESKKMEGLEGETKEGGAALLARRSGRKVTLNPKGAAYQLETKEKSYNVLLKELKKTGAELLEEDVSERVKADEVFHKTVTKKVRQWLHGYVTLMQTAIDLQALLPADRKEEHLSSHAEIGVQLNQMKEGVDALQKELALTDHETKLEGSVAGASTTSSSMRANLMMLRLQDERKKAEVKAQLMAVKKRQELLKERQDLELREKELELQVQLDIQNAQEDISEKFEQELLNEDGPDEYQKDTQVKTNVKTQEKNSDGNAQAEGILTGLAHIISKSQNQLPVLEPEVFKGDVEQFAMWLKSFECYIESRTTESTERLHYLATYTGGSAKRAIQGLLQLRSVDAYSKAKQKLIERYGNDFVTANAYRQRLHSWPHVRPGDGKALRELADFLEGCLVAAQTVPGLNNLGNIDDITQLLKRLPRYLVDRWRRVVDEHIYERDKSEYPGLEVFVNFLTKEARVACGPVSLETDQDKLKKTRDRAGAFASSTGAVAERKSDRNFRRTDPSYQATSSSQSAPDSYRWKCVLCVERHPLDSCEVFAKMSLPEKHVVIRKHGVCRGCLRIGHIWKECKRRRECGKCHGAHPTLLHDDDFRSSRGTPGRSVSVETQTATTLKTEIRSPPSDADDGTPCFHSLIVPVLVHHRTTPEHKEMVYAILDPQSDGTFITESVCDKIKAPGVETSLELSTITGKTEVKAKAVTGLVIEALDSSSEISLPTTYTREDMPVDRQLIPRRETAANWSHLREVAESLPPYYPEASIGLLIGLNCSKAIKPQDIVTGDDNAPWAVRTAMGWGVVGLARGNRTCCFASCDGAASRQCHFTLRTRAREIGPSHLIEMLETGFQDQPQEKKISQQDKRFVDLMETQMHATEDGHMEAPLPLKDPEVVLPDNKKLAMQRLQGLKKRFERDPGFQAEYNTFMTEMLETGVAEPVPEEELGGAGSNGVWYLPHHGVRHPRKQKIRVVFDCSCEFDGRSLNSELMQGPDMANNLCGILTRFRKLPVALTCDIRGMFNQVKVNQEHRNLLRFLWWKDGNLQEEPTEFRMTTHLFGATSSPSCAMFALNKTAELYEEECGPEAAAFVRHDFYVDDGLISTPDKTSACDLAGSATMLCSKGGFQLHQFTSNEPDVIASIPEENRSKNLQNKDVVDEYKPVEQALGLSWNIQDDTLLLTGDLPDRPVTRRGILSTVSSLYDPLGLVCPFTLQGKQILKRLCCDGGGWDEPVHEECWLDWKADLATLSTFAVPRCYVPSSCLVESYELHNFSDASLEGLGACSYLRMKTTDGQLYSSLVLGKARVTPKRVTTVPRLELAAALLSTKTSQFLKQELNIPNLREYFWCDSKVVLGYIGNEDKRFHVFVANCVQQIRQYTSPDH
ncbi:uncharacterized protein LOC122368497 [Amphibalanus amphitrite]|uniref:uncharacterized protein LOC122368497 n=1 Tax=Amphibalanus amphitrite TaxID=1232801 RepID=UPI001C915688|nr:uncharacterized protein LOC122368497 [Amphibalanus amphitrite]